MSTPPSSGSGNQARRALGELTKFSYEERLEAFVEDPSLFEYVDDLLRTQPDALDQTGAILAEIENERRVQRGRWGDEFDDGLSDAWWGNMLGAYLGRVQSAIFTRGEKPTDEAALRYIDVEDVQLRVDLLKVACICVAYVEAIDRRAK